MLGGPTSLPLSVACCGVGSWSRGRGNGGVVGRLGRQGTGYCRLLWGVEETGKRPLETRFRLLGLWGQRKRCCVLVAWLHGLRDGHALEYCIGRISYKGFLCPLSEIPGLPLRDVCLSVGPSSSGCLSVCLSCGPSSSGCLSVWASFRVDYLLRVCRVGFSLRVVVAAGAFLFSGLVTMSSIVMNRTGLKRTLFVLSLDSDRVCCCPGRPWSLE